MSMNLVLCSVSSAFDELTTDKDAIVGKLFGIAISHREKDLYPTVEEQGLAWAFRSCRPPEEMLGLAEEIRAGHLADLVVRFSDDPALASLGVPSDRLRAMAATVRQENIERLASVVDEGITAYLRRSYSSDRPEAPVRRIRGIRKLGGPCLNLRKAWHGIHFLLTGTAVADDSVAGQILLGGTEIGPDLGYGPVRHLPNTIVSAASDLLEGVSRATLSSRYDGARMRALDIYPNTWEDEDDPSWLLDAFERTRNYYQNAALMNRGMLITAT